MFFSFEKCAFEIGVKNLFDPAAKTEKQFKFHSSYPAGFPLQNEMQINFWPSNKYAVFGKKNLVHFEVLKKKYSKVGIEPTPSSKNTVV